MTWPSVLSLSLADRVRLLPQMGPRSHLGIAQRSSPSPCARRGEQALASHGSHSRQSKCHLLVDTLGLVLGIHVTPAITPEREGAEALLRRVLPWFAWLRLIWIDGGYTGDLLKHALAKNKTVMFYTFYYSKLITL